MNVMIENMPASHELGYSPMEIKEIIEKTGYEGIRIESKGKVYKLTF